MYEHHLRMIVAWVEFIPTPLFPTHTLFHKYLLYDKLSAIWSAVDEMRIRSHNHK